MPYRQLDATRANSAQGCGSKTVRDVLPGGCRRARRSRLVYRVTFGSGLAVVGAALRRPSSHHLRAPGQGVERSRRCWSRPRLRPAFDAAHAPWHEGCQPYNARTAGTRGFTIGPAPTLQGRVVPVATSESLGRSQVVTRFADFTCIGGRSGVRRKGEAGRWTRATAGHDRPTGALEAQPFSFGTADTAL